MSRIRTIKPEFWTSEQVVECSTTARLLFIGLWNFCDDYGNHPASPRQIKAEVFPCDDFTAANIQGMLLELSRNGLIIFYSVEGKDYFHVTGWSHQRIDKRQKAKFPPYPENVRRTVRDMETRTFRDHSATIPEPVVDRAIAHSTEHIAQKQQPEIPEHRPKAQTQPQGRPEPKIENAPERKPAGRSKRELDEIEALCRAAAAVADSPNAPGKFCDLSAILGFLDEGVSLDETILPVLEAAKAKGHRAKSWAYFAPAIIEAIERRGASAGLARRSQQGVDPPASGNGTLIADVALTNGQTISETALGIALTEWREHRRWPGWMHSANLSVDDPSFRRCQIPDDWLARYGLTRPAEMNRRERDEAREIEADRRRQIPQPAGRGPPQEPPDETTQSTHSPARAGPETQEKITPWAASPNGIER
jgi:hypothetical protein